MSTPWDTRTYDLSRQPRPAWASEVLGRLEGIALDATVWMSGTAPVARAGGARLAPFSTSSLTSLDAIVSTAMLHWVTDHDRL